MTTSASHPRLFAVACPACGGRSAATAGMAGQPACCPQCAATFLVPEPPASSVPTPATAAVALVVADVPPAPSDRAPVVADVRPAAAELAPVVAAPAPITATTPAEPARVTGGERSPAERSSPAAAFTPVPAGDADPASDLPADVAAEVRFQEPPARVVGHGRHAVELRRLSPEEKEIRRRRRNILLLLTGAAILIAIALLFS